MTPVPLKEKGLAMPDSDLPVLQVIVGSTRPGRAGLRVARWAFERAGKHGGFAAELIDLAEIGLRDDEERDRLSGARVGPQASGLVSTAGWPGERGRCTRSSRRCRC